MTKKVYEVKELPAKPNTSCLDLVVIGSVLSGLIAVGVMALKIIIGG